MEQIAVAGMDRKLSRLIQGTMMLSFDEIESSFSLLDTVFEAGCNTFDTGHVYGAGDCERVLGQWLVERGVRDSVVIIDKGAHPNPDRRRVTPFDISADVHDSLARLKTDHIDLYLLHRDDPAVDVRIIMDALNEHLSEGRVRAIGVSNWEIPRIAQANSYAAANGLVGFVASSPHFSLAEQVEDPWGGCITLTGPQAAHARAWYVEQGMPVLAWSSLANGFLSGCYSRRDIEAFPEDTEEGFVRWYRSPRNLERLDRALELAADKGVTVPQIALAYVACQRMTVCPIVGSRTPEEFLINAQAVNIKLSEEEMAYLNIEDQAD